MNQVPDTKPGNYYVTAVRDDGAVAFLAGHPAVDSDRIGITGFCMGGRVACWLPPPTPPSRPPCPTTAATSWSLGAMPPNRHWR